MDVVTDRRSRLAPRVYGALASVLLLATTGLVGTGQTSVARQTTAAADSISHERLMSTVNALASPAMEGRQTGTPGGEKARAWLLAAFKDTGLSPTAPDYSLPFRFRPNTGMPVDGLNVAATCPGIDANLPVIVISAHYDHLGIRNGLVHPGADDNASGVAVLLELAHRCRRVPFRHTILFVAFDAEEQGLHGARAFVASPPAPRDRLALNVNLDMVARGDRGELYAAGTYHYPRLASVLRPVAEQSAIKLLFGHDRPGTGTDDWTHLSDHGPFHDARIPFVYFGVEDHPDYHKPTDTPDKIDPLFFRRAAETILDAVIALDREVGPH
jgi:Zn-dependent M28 family amino/carboxypeptidase